jgi:hypothetical protein
VGGRSSDSFVIRDRIYPRDGAGVVSEATPDGPSVSIRGQYPMNPNVINLLGMEEPTDDLSPNNVLSITSMLIPGMTNADSKRAGFANIQISQQIPTANNEVSRVRTTYERVVAHLTGPPFSYVATQDGVVLDINNTLGIIKIEYADGSKVAVDFGSRYSSYSSSSLHIEQRIATRLKAIGEIFKEGDVLCYNQDYFMEDPYSTQVIWKLGKRVCVAIIATNGTFEDGNIICKELADDFIFNPVHVNTLTLSRTNVIHKFAELGTSVKSTEPILVYEEDDSLVEEDLDIDDAAVLESFMELNRRMPKADYAGKVVKIDVLYTSAVTSMHPTMQKFIKHIEKHNQQLAKYTADVKNGVPANKPITTAKKLGVTDLTADTVIVKYYIQGSYPGRGGDKYVFGGALKTVTSTIDPNPIYTEDGTLKILAKFSSLSISNRIVPDTRLLGTASLVMKKAQEDIMAIFDDKLIQ